MQNKGLLALATLIGTIVGAGIFGVPYVISKSGLIPGFFYLFVLGGAILLIHLLFGEVVLRTEGRHHLPMMARKYLGKWGKALATVSLFVGLAGILLAYIIIGGDFLKTVFSPLFDAPSFYFTLFFLAFLSYFVFRGLKLIALTEVITNFGFFLIIFVIFLIAFPKIQMENFALINYSNLFLPYGVILFSFLGFTAIPEVGAILGTSQERKKFRKTVILAFLIIIAFYVFFSLTVVGVSGGATSPDTLQGLLPFLGPQIIFLGALAAVITLADSFLAIAIYLKNTLIFDYKVPRLIAFLITCGVPLVLFLLGFRSFILTIGIIGTIIGVIEGVLIILIFKQAKSMGDRKPEYSLKVPSALLYFLGLLLILGVVFQFIL